MALFGVQLQTGFHVDQDRKKGQMYIKAAITKDAAAAHLTLSRVVRQGLCDSAPNVEGAMDFASQALDEGDPRGEIDVA